jgi:hypothetical protein
MISLILFFRKPGVTYENIKLKDGIDIEVYENLDFVIMTGTALAIPQHSKI